MKISSFLRIHKVRHVCETNKQATPRGRAAGYTRLLKGYLEYLGMPRDP
jgi:hypothetical protein